MKNLPKYIFYLALITFLISVVSSLVNYFSIVEVPYEYQINNSFELLIHLVFAYIIYWIWKENLFAQLLLLLSSIVEVLAYFIIEKAYGEAFQGFALLVLVNAILFLIIGCLITTNFVYLLLKWANKTFESSTDQPH